MQCARGYHESGKRVHLFNMLKYALSISIAVVSYSQGRSLGTQRLHSIAGVNGTLARRTDAVLASLDAVRLSS